MPKTRKKQNHSHIRSITALALACAVLAGLICLRLRLEPAQAEPSLRDNPYTATDFAYRDGYLTCTAGEAVRGIDVSSHQQAIDWAQVADSGVSFAFVRIGYRGYTQGSIHADDYAHQNLTEAHSAGLQVGAYFYSQAIDPEEAVEEAEFCIEFLEQYHLDLPVVFDWEYVSSTARTGSMNRETLTACALAFCRTVEAAGYRAMVYFNPDIGLRLLDLEQLAAYPFWLALYGDHDFPYQVEFWQYTQEGTVPGISGKVDINLRFQWEDD